jgi:hypothetical protein
VGGPPSLNVEKACCLCASATLRKEGKLRTFEGSVCGNTFGPKESEVSLEITYDELGDLYRPCAGLMGQ